MIKQITAVAEFHEKFLQENNESPTLQPEQMCNLRHKLMAEENDEYLEACAEGNLIGIADALGDMMYILCGTILKHGMQHVMENVFDEIHRSNLSKLDGDGIPIMREDGKIIKGEHYTPPDLTKFI
jgi:predicted HAD superfamily Cof-like phosphohydrolase